MSTAPAEPVRTCVGCRRREIQSKLLRTARAVDERGVKTVVVDTRRCIAGRGAWLHPDPACLSLAIKKRAFNRAFRGEAETADLERRFSATKDAPASAATTVQPESGSEN